MTGRLATPLIGACLALMCTGTLIGQRTSVSKGCPHAQPASFRSISQSEVESIIKDLAVSNPRVVELLREDQEMRAAQLENMRELLAFASQAIRDGLADDEINCSELSNVSDETIAVAYDRHLNKAKPAKGPFGYISAARVSSFWGTAPGAKIAESVRKDRETKFQKFLETKKAILARNNPGRGEVSIGDDEVAAAKDAFAKYQIYVSEYKRMSSVLPVSVRDQIAFQVKLQQAQYLARLYADVAVWKTQATDEEVAAYLADHKELSSEPKRAKAEQILARAKNGEDFAKLANEFTQDPGNKGQNGELNGGAYQNVPRGTMVKPFESAALSLEAGQVHPTVVESDFGFHIIKLDRKEIDDSGTYDVRHILLSTTVPDPDDPNAREIPVRTYVKSQIEAEKQKAMIAEAVKAADVTVPSDFSIPSPASTTVVKRKAPSTRRVVRKRK